MAERRALVLVDGMVAELPFGDELAGTADLRALIEDLRALIARLEGQPAYVLSYGDHVALLI